MVLGVTAKNKRGPSVHVDYLIHIQEIKPWPPSQSLRSLRSVLILWENGERNSGSTNTVIPSIGSVVGEGKIEFNESFRLRVNLLREVSVKGRDAETFQKNCLEFNLYEPRRDKTQLLATAIIDLADYGVVKETLSVSAPMNSKRSFRNTAEPVLYLKIQPVDKGRASSSLRDSLSKQASLDKNGGESVSALMNEEYAEEAESTSSTDDDVSSHSSLTLTVSSSAFENNGSLPPQNGENGPVKVTDRTEGVNKEHALASKMGLEKSNTMSHITRHENLKGSSSRSSSIDSSSDIGSPVNGHAFTQNSPNSSAMSNVAANGVHSSSSSTSSENKGEEANARRKINDHEDLAQEVQEMAANGRIRINGDAQQISKENTFKYSSAEVASSAGSPQMIEKLGSINSGDAHVNGEDDGKAWRIGKNSVEEVATPDDIYNSSMEDIDGKKQEKNGEERQNLEEKKHHMGDEPLNISSRDASGNQVSLETDTLSLSRGNLGMMGNIVKIDRLKHVKSVRSPLDSSRSNGLVTSNQHAEAKEVSVLGDAQNGAGSLRSNERKDAKIYPKDTRSAILDSKIQKLEHKIKMLEGELREAAAIEAALYSVMADHGSSMSKVHAPARRLSRLYLHESCQTRRASAARSAVSGLVLVAKACGNDVPRLTFWLSNSVVLRAIISQATGDPELPLSAGPPIERNGSGKGKNISSPLKWKQFSPNRKENKHLIHRSFGDWEDPRTFTSALERIEAWIFTRIIESIWWQTLTPHMQSAATKAIDRGIGSGSKNDYRRTSSSVDQDQENLSSELWKKAFKDACERLCPVRAGGHDCGCLPVLARLIMEQCVARLDVAMFNAILRESDDEIPTDPVSDPISDSKVLPIPAGKASFGAGAQLKNAIGNWSRWLTDLFGMDDDDALEAENGRDDNDGRQDSSFKSFHLLNALSDLMMLPKDMLLSRSIRKEVCPTFGTPLIKRVLDNFVPDEFCPDPIPDVVLEALDSEDPLEAGEESVANFPCIAAPPVYSPPSAASLAAIISGEAGSQAQLRRSGSSVLRKSYTSDDELDELNSPLASIFMGASRSSPVPAKPSWRSKENGNQNAVRYELLRDIWMNSE